MRLTSKTILVAALSAGSLAASATGAFAYGSYGSYDGGGSRGGDVKTVSYINPDTGAATANPDVDQNSSCFNPDQYDMQAFSTATANNNVHNDACFLDDRGNKVGKSIGATFQSSGTGFIAACPDPDGAGPAVAVLRDLDKDGRNDSCFQSSYQEKGVAGDFEYHARVNNTGMAGQQQVEWGMDRDADGRIDDYRSDDVEVDWSTDGRSSSSRSW